jgi:hypothetical protein
LNLKICKFNYGTVDAEAASKTNEIKNGDPGIHPSVFALGTHSFTREK